MEYSKKKKEELIEILEAKDVAIETLTEELETLRQEKEEAEKLAKAPRYGGKLTKTVSSSVVKINERTKKLRERREKEAKKNSKKG